jgi:hypothetical protein
LLLGSQTDPDNQGTADAYEFDGDDPINITDPTGLCFIVSCSVYHAVGHYIADHGADIVIAAGGCAAGADAGAEYGTLVAAPEAGAAVGCLVGEATALIGSNVANPPQSPP